MITDELSIFGYCCTGRVVSARQPTSRITRLTTIASTGCLINTSVKERMGFPSRVVPIPSVFAGRYLTRPATIPRITVDCDKRRISQFEGPRDGHLLAAG